MFNGSNLLSELGSQLHPALCASLQGTHSLQRVGERPSLVEMLGGEIKEGFREELTVSAKLGRISFAGTD